MQLLDFITAHPQIWGPLITVSITIFLFFLTRIIDSFRNYYQYKQLRTNLINGLYLEIKNNVKVIDQFLRLMPRPDKVVELVTNDRNYIPHLTYANHTFFYGGHVRDLPMFPPTITEKLIEFYCNLESLKSDIGALERKSFSTVTDRGGVIRDIWEQMEKTKVSGLAAIDLFKTKYPKEIVT